MHPNPLIKDQMGMCKYTYIIMHNYYMACANVQSYNYIPHMSGSNSSMITWSNLTSDMHATEFLKFYKSNIACFL